MRGGGKADVAGARRCSAEQTRHIVAVANTITGFALCPHIGVCDVRTHQSVRLTAAHFVEAATDYHVSIRLHADAINRSSGVIESGTVQTCELIVCRIHESGVHRSIGLKANHAAPVRAVVVVK